MNFDDKKEKEFESYINRLRSVFEENPQFAIKESRRSLRRIEEMKKYENLPINDFDREQFLSCVLIIIVALLGLFNVSSYGVYFFGLVFFIAGHFVGLTQKGFGLIFLFSHSVTGMGMMYGALLYKMFESPILQDNAINLYISIGIIAVLAIIATLYTILYNLSDNLKKKEFSMQIPLIIYMVSFTLAGFLSLFYEKIYTLRIF